MVRHARLARAACTIAGLGLALLGFARDASAHSTMIINDRSSPGTLGDDRLSLHEALQLATGSLQIFQLSVAEARQVILDPGRFQIDTLIFDETVFPGTIVLDAPLPVLDDPIGDYIDSTNFNLFPIGSIVLDGSRLPAGTPAFDIRAGNTGLYGWRLRGFAGHGIHVRPNPTFDVMRGLLIQRNVVEDCTGVGILLDNGARDRIDWAFLLLENWITRCQGGGIAVRAGSGANVTMDFTLEANLVVGNGVPGGRADGVAIQGSRGGSIDLTGRLVANDLLGNAGSGVLLDGGSSGSLLSFVLADNETLANGVGITVHGASGAGATPNDLSLSVRGHVSREDRLAAVVATGGADPGAVDAYVSVSLSDLLVRGGCALGGILATSGDGTGNQLSLALARCEVLRPAGDGLRVLTSVAPYGPQRVEVRCVALHVVDPGADGLVIESGGGTPSDLRATVDGAFVRGGRHGLRVDALPGATPSDRLDLAVTGSRFAGQQRAGALLRAQASSTADVRFRLCVFDGSQGDDVVLEDPLSTGNLRLSLGEPTAFGLNAFLDRGGCALVLPASAGPVDCVGNYFGAGDGPAPGGSGKCIRGNARTTPFLGSDLSLRLDPTQRVVPPGGSLSARVTGTPGTTAALFVGTRVLDLTAFGRPLLLDPTSGPVVWLGSAVLPGALSLAIPSDPALVGGRVFLQAFGADPGDVRLSRVHALSILY